MVTNDWRIWLASMVFTLFLTIAFMVYIWWQERKGNKARKDDEGAKLYTDAEGYYLCVFLKGGGCDLHKASEVKQVVKSESGDYVNVMLQNGDVTHYEDANSYEFKHIIDLATYNLKTVIRMTE